MQERALGSFSALTWDNLDRARRNHTASTNRRCDDIGCWLIFKLLDKLLAVCLNLKILQRNAALVFLVPIGSYLVGQSITGDIPLLASDLALFIFIFAPFTVFLLDQGFVGLLSLDSRTCGLLEFFLGNFFCFIRVLFLDIENFCSCWRERRSFRVLNCCVRAWCSVRFLWLRSRALCWPWSWDFVIRLLFLNFIENLCGNRVIHKRHLPINKTGYYFSDVIYLGKCFKKGQHFKKTLIVGVIVPAQNRNSIFRVEMVSIWAVIDDYDIAHRSTEQRQIFDVTALIRKTVVTIQTERN